MADKKKYYIPVARVNGHTRNFGKKRSEETKQKMGESQKKRFQDPLQRRLLKESHARFWNNPENRRRMSEIHKKPYNTLESIMEREERRKKKLAEIEARKEFRKKHPVQRTPEQKQMMRELKFKEVHQYSMTGEYLRTFKSTADALESLGKARNNSTISNHLNGRHNSAFNFKWSFVKSNLFIPSRPKVKRKFTTKEKKAKARKHKEYYHTHKEICIERNRKSFQKRKAREDMVKVLENDTIAVNE
jgi:hypothetical protein